MKSPLGTHHLPPSDFARRDLPICVWRTPFLRIHEIRFGVIFYGATGDNRFDDPDCKFGVLYAGADEYAAFIETFGQKTGVNMVTRKALEANCLTSIVPERDLRLVDLTGAGLAQCGADARLTTGDHYISRQWSRAFREHPANVDGVLFRSRHDPERLSAAIYDRGVGWETTTLGGFSEKKNRILLAELLNHYGFGLDSDFP